MTTEPIPRWKLERYLLGELSEHERAAINRRLKEDPETARAVDELRRSDEELRRRFPADVFVPRIKADEARLRAQASAVTPSPRRALRKFLIPSASLVAAAALLLVVVFREVPGNRVKGGGASGTDQARIQVYRKAGSSVETLKDGDLVRAGDLLQIAYTAAGKPYGVIVSLDGRGAVNLHYPDSPLGSTRLKSDPQVMLQMSYELDDAPDFECFYFITSPAEIDIRSVLDKISAAGKLGGIPPGRRVDLPAAWDRFTICFRKGQRP